MYQYQSSNICLCNPQPVTTTTPTPTCPEDSCDCLIAANLILNAKDSTAIGPCGKTGVFELDPFNTNTAGCVETLTYQLIQYDSEGFSSVTVSSTGTVTFTTADTAEGDTYYNIIYKIICESKGLASFGYLTIGIKDLCEFVSCSSGTCDKCTGDCDVPITDLGISITGTLL